MFRQTANRTEHYEGNWPCYGVISAIVVASGKGTCMGTRVGKLFLELDRCPIVAHTWRRFEGAGCSDELLLVVSGTCFIYQGVVRR
jgi:2-C-methyl-D-erythritol 4-phosphate cytidylyltransferase